MKMRKMPGAALAVQTALIVLPVTILSGIALYSLREDRAAILRDARDRARSLSPYLARQLGLRISEMLRGQTSPLRGVIAAGWIAAPSDSGALPSPPDWPESMPPAASTLWRVGQEAIFGRRRAEEGRVALMELARRSSSPAVRVNAEAALLTLNAGRLSPVEAARRYVDLARRSAGIVTESGAPVTAVALLAALRGSPGRLPDGWLAVLAEQIHNRPSFLDAQLLDEAERYAAAEIGKLRAEWTAWRTTVDSLRAILQDIPGEGASFARWLPDRRLIALGMPRPDGWQVTLFSGDEFQRALSRAFAATGAPGGPNDAEVAMQFGGERWHAGGGRPQKGFTELASARGVLEIGTPHPFELEIDAEESSLLATYRRGVWRTGALILFGAAASLIGLISLWRGFQRQVRLAEMKSNFVSSVSHELRAPLGAVRLMAENLERGTIEDPARQREYFRVIAQECRRLTSLVENVLDFSRMDAGRKQYRFEPVGLMPLVSQAVELMQPHAGERQVELVLAPPANGAADLRPCWDGYAVEQSLVNLIDNAIKHSPGGATVKLEVEAVGSWVRLWVEDSGEGIPREEQERIFDRFYRSGSELRRNTKGAGIGLSIVKHVAEAHGGRVLVESTVGKGSRFGLELPLPEHP